MTSAAQQEPSAEPFALQATGTHGANLALKQAIAERVAAHRQRRGTRTAAEPAPGAVRREGSRAGAGGSGAARVREAVAARYGSAPSYRDLLAAEAERALREAQAEAEAAARSFQAAADAQIELLAELQTWQEAEQSPRELAREAAQDEARGELAHALADIALGARELIAESEAEGRMASRQASGAAGAATGLTELSAGGLTVRLYEDVREDVQADRQAERPAELSAAPATRRCLRRGALHPLPAAPAGGERQALEQELASHQDPFAQTAPPGSLEVSQTRATHFGFPSEPPLEAGAIETTGIPANLIEFPRELIAPRKARPRLAEGPLREEAPSDGQLRIFEVAAETIETAPAAQATAAPGWQSLLLEAAVPDHGALPAEPFSQLALPPQVASLGRRLMAALVDACCLLGALAGFCAVAAKLAGPALLALPRPVLGALAASVLSGFYVLYQMLFFTLSHATPGMLYARVALCTFGDDNPSRRAMRRRLLATLLAAAPLGLGLVWSFLDSERLGWHDRISRMYQRAY